MRAGYLVWPAPLGGTGSGEPSSGGGAPPAGHKPRAGTDSSHRPPRADRELANHETPGSAPWTTSCASRPESDPAAV